MGDVETPRNGLLDVRGCRGIVVRGLAVDHDPLPFTQGTIRATDPVAGTLDLEIHDSYPLPSDDAELKRLCGPNAWDWGTVMDPVDRHRRWDVKDFLVVGAVGAVPDRSR